MSAPPTTSASKPSVLSQLRNHWNTPRAAGRQVAYPPIRNFVLDVMAEGRRKNIINLVMQADITAMLTRQSTPDPVNAGGPSITSLVAYAMVLALNEHKEFNAYRLGNSRLVIFDDIDLSFTVEREIDGVLLPVPCIVRAANQKSAEQIHGELQAAKFLPTGENGPMSALEKYFFLLPHAIRGVLWFFIRRDPYKFKQLVGTVGVTSMGMFAAGAAVVQPITPMTLTLSIGAIEKKAMLKDDASIERSFIHLNLSADHDIIDGAPLMRFADTFRRRLEQS